MANKEYQGWRSSNGDAYVLVVGDGLIRELGHVILHSPTGLEWGYGGSGPADAALSILVDFFDEGRKFPPSSYRKYETFTGRLVDQTQAGRLYHLFKDNVIAKLGRVDGPVPLHGQAYMEWSLGEAQIALALAEIREHYRHEIRDFEGFIAERVEADGKVTHEE